VSTNAVSKAAYDLAAARDAGPRARRLAASGGYETSAVTTADALIFLAGTNVGAAVYEHGAARATRAFLHRR
jgi:hypothetical protein